MPENEKLAERLRSARAACPLLLDEAADDRAAFLAVAGRGHPVRHSQRDAAQPCKLLGDMLGLVRRALRGHGLLSPERSIEPLPAGHGRVGRTVRVRFARELTPPREASLETAAGHAHRVCGLALAAVLFEGVRGRLAFLAG